MVPSRARVVLAGLALVALALATGCTKTGPGSLSTPLSPAPQQVTLRPPPPKGVYWLRIRSAQVSARNEGGQLWDDVGALPDPYVRVSVDDEVLLESEAASDNLNPVYDGRGANFEIDSDAQLVVELRDADTLRDFTMGRAVVAAPGRTELDLGEMKVATGNRSSVVIEVEPAHALIGLGFDYRLWGNKVTVTEVWKHSPAGRGGMKPGDKIVKIGTRDVSDMQSREVRSALNAIGKKKIDLVVQHKSGTTTTVPMNMGPIYPLFEEYGLID